MSERARLETALHYQRGRSLKQGDTFGLEIREAGLRRHLSIRGQADCTALSEALQSVAGVALPTRPLSLKRRGSSLIFWQGPTEWMLVTDFAGSESLASDLRRELAGQPAAVVDVSGGQTLLSLSGPAVMPVLQKSSSYDFHPSNFPVGKCVQTVFAKSAALVAKSDEEGFLLLVRRSYADYIGLWLLDAASEYGVKFSG
jgi:sarcosine oxidase subunit gamma